MGFERYRYSLGGVQIYRSAVGRASWASRVVRSVTGLRLAFPTLQTQSREVTRHYGSDGTRLFYDVFRKEKEQQGFSIVELTNTGPSVLCM